MSEDRPPLRLVSSQADEDHNTAEAVVKIRGNFRLLSRFLLHMLRYAEVHGGLEVTIESKGGR